jgi:hypothetical protein
LTDFQSGSRRQFATTETEVHQADITAPWLPIAQEGTEEKDLAMTQWCERITERIGKPWRFKRINQIEFNKLKGFNLADLLDSEPSLV